MLQGAAFRILACFYDSDIRSFVELCERAGYPTDLGGYYLRQLVRGGYVQKLERGKYTVLPKGKQELAFRYGKSWLSPKPRLMVAIVARQGKRLVLLRRTVQPFMGVTEWPAGMVSMGESLQSATKRILEARTGCSGTAKLIGFFRRIDQYDDSMFDDKLFAVHIVTIAKESHIQPNNTVGDIFLCEEAALYQAPRLAKSLLDILAFSYSTTRPLFEEHTYTITLADLSLEHS